MNVFYELEHVIYSAILATRHYSTKGDYYEFGCYQGSSLIAAYHLANSSLDHQMHFNVFDSFMGLPAPSEMDSHESYKEGAWSCSYNEFKDNIVKNGVNLEHVTIWPGFYDKSLNAQARTKFTAKASIVLIDCDIYESTRDALNFMTPVIQEGTIIIFDDYFLHRGKLDRGEAKALWEWLDENRNIKVTEYLRSSNGVNSFIVNTA